MPAQNIVAVFDTNILIRMALGKTPASQRMWDAVQESRFILLTSPLIVSEVRRVLNYRRIAKRHALTEQDIQEFIESLEGYGTMLKDIYEVARVEADPSDNIFLACALEGGADYLVSEDPHLRNIKYYHGVQIVGLAQFQKIIGL